MSIRKMIMGLTLASLSTASFAHVHKSINKTITIKAKDKYMKTMKYLQKNGYDVLGVDFKAGIIDVNVDDSEYQALQKLGVDLQLQKQQKKKKIDERYLNSEEVQHVLAVAASRFSDIAKLEVIGETLEGRKIFAIKISDNAHEREVGEPTVLFNGMHHSREIMTPEVTTDIVKYLTENYGKDQRVTNWVNNNEIWVLPMLNIDGNTKVWSGDSMWRKNARGGYGVDINRNYPASWGACNGSSGWRHSQTYRGSEAGSEPETKVMMNFVSRIKPVFNISYHAYSELVIYPMGCKGERTANKEVVEGIGKEMGRRLRYQPGTAWETLYSVDGSDIDWMYEAEQVIPYVIEVSPRSDGFHPSYDKRDATVERNRLGWQFLLERMEGPGLHGITKNHQSIDIYRNGEKVHSYRVNPDGSYHIILQAGEYDVKFIGEETVQKTVEIKDKKVVLKKL
jgi:carboxypeptidase T